MQKLLVGLSLWSLMAAYCFANTTDLPLRKDYPDIYTIEVDELFKLITDDSVVIVDVRSDYEYQTLRILGAIHIPIGNIAFSSKIKALRENTDKTIVFYCNGITCKKSYKAAVIAEQEKITGTYAFDAGIALWARTYPTYTQLLGENLVTEKRLISSEKLAKHTLTPQEFEKKVASENTIVIDIRDTALRTIKAFPEFSRNIPLNRFDDAISYASRNQSTLLIYDFVGKQTRWLQYKLENAKVKQYYFLEGGAKNYRDYLDKKI